MTDAIRSTSQAVDVLEEALETGAEDLGEDVSTALRESAPLPEFTNDHINPWDRQPGESDRNWKLFRYYLDLGLGRTYTGTARPHGLKQPDVSRAAAKFDWKHRALAYENEKERLYQFARGAAIREMADRHATQIQDAINGLAAPFEALQLKMDNEPDFIEELSETSTKALIDLATKSARVVPSLMNAERLARGMPTEIVAGEVTHEHSFTIDRDQFAEVLAVMDRAGVLDERLGSLPSGEVVEAEVVDVHPVSAEGDDGSQDSGDQP